MNTEMRETEDGWRLFQEVEHGRQMTPRVGNSQEPRDRSDSNIYPSRLLHTITYSDNRFGARGQEELASDMDSCISFQTLLN